MARVDIKYNEQSIQTSTYVVEEIEHESMDNKELNIQRLGNNDGGKIVSQLYDVKIVRIRGTVFGTDIDNLEDNIDQFKFLLNQDNKPLDVEYAGDWRRYDVYTSKINYVRRHYNLTFAEYEAEFVVAFQPFGHSIDTSTIEQGIIVTGTSTIEGSYTFEGTRRPLPIIQTTVNSETGLSQMIFTNVTTGSYIIVDYVFEDLDVLTIDTENYTVVLTRAGVDTAIDYRGMFPDFARSTNRINVGLRATAADITVKYIYYSLYL